MTEPKDFSGFDPISDMFLSKLDSDTMIDPEEIERKMAELDKLDESNSIEESEIKTPEKPAKLDNKIKKSDKIDSEEESEDIDNKLDNKDKDTSKEDSSSELEEVEYEEEDLIDTFADLFAEELDWKFEEGEKPKSMKDLVDYMQNIIEENSIPKYASDQVKELDDFVKNGGDLTEFYKKVYNQEVNIDTVDLTKESNQKIVIKENLRNRGYSEARIEKLITRYEEADSLEDEANDSLEELKEFREKNKAQLLESQEKQAKASLKQEQEFISNVQKIINDATSIRGVELSKKEKQQLIDYIFKPEKDGETKYQKEYNKDLLNLVESAFFTMKGKDFVQQIEKKATAEATKKLKLKLKTKGKGTKNAESDQDESNNKVQHLWEIAGRELRKY